MSGHRIISSQRTRGPNLAILIKRNPGVPMDEAIMIADREGLVIASNRRLDKALAWGSEWEGLVEGLNCWTGTMTAFNKPGEKLGKEVEYVNKRNGIRWVFPVPHEYGNEKDAILVVEHPDFSLEIDGKNRVIRAENVAIVTGFPSESGFYLTDLKYGIPVGNKAYEPNSRVLLKYYGRWVGLISRGVAFKEHRINIHLGGGSGSETNLGVIVEAPAKEIKEAEPAPAKEGAKKDGILAEGYGIEAILLSVVHKLHDMLDEKPPMYIYFEIKGSIGFLVHSYKLAKVMGWDTQGHVKASNALGEFVSKELASDPRYKDLVPELKKYFIQKIQEVQK